MNKTEQKYFGDRFPEQLNQNLGDQTKYYRRHAILSKKDNYIYWLAKLIRQSPKGPNEEKDTSEQEESKSQMQIEIATETDKSESYDYKSASVFEVGDTGVYFSA